MIHWIYDLLEAAEGLPGVGRALWGVAHFFLRKMPAFHYEVGAHNRGSNSTGDARSSRGGAGVERLGKGGT